MRIPFFHNRRQEILDQPFPAEWRPILEQQIGHYKLLTLAERERLEDDLRIFHAEKFWEGGADFEVTDEMKVVVSALACLLTVGFAEHDYYPNVESIIIYPAGYHAPTTQLLMGGVVESGYQDRLGEAHGYNGPVLISWSDLNAGGHSVVLHEFAHKLDFQSGSADGVPRLHTQEQYDRWAEVMSREYQQLVEDSHHRSHMVLDPYGATNAAEFFAVVTEAYFGKPVKLRESHPELYGVLREFYGIDWAERWVV